jgi:UDP-N-acetylmuramoyl-tripeptide--D-alanyl-D-alanine ligase
MDFTTISTDTRKLTAGALFVALSGDNFDGHNYLTNARDAGAIAALVRRGTPDVDGLLLYQVEDTLQGLGDLAAAQRHRIRGPVVAITGQNGKTSTKEMVAAVMGTRWKTHRTRANLNNLIGVPLTILEAPEDTEALVIEAGANQPGEIARYREIIAPDVAIVINAGSGHLAGFGSVQGVVREKLALTEDVALAIVGVSPPTLSDGAMARGAREVITAGFENADITPASVELTPDGRPDILVDGISFTLAARGRHQAGNAMFAWALVRRYQLVPAAAAAALEQIQLPGGRGELSQHGELTLLNDGYNANPESLATTIALARELRAGRRLAFVAGTMRELGDATAELHRKGAAQLAELAPDVLALVGEFGPAFDSYRAGFRGVILDAPDSLSMAPLLAAELQGNELLVLKGSRGTALELMLPDILLRTTSA